MEYHKEDGWLFGPENTRNKAEGWTMVCWLICLIVLSALLGCDGESASITAQLEQDAHERHVETVRASLMQIPCTYVCQKYHYEEPCGKATNTRCVKADFQ